MKSDKLRYNFVSVLGFHPAQKKKRFYKLFRGIV